MPEYLDYTLVTETISANADSYWGDADVDVDGNIDNGLLPIKVTLTPTNPATHSISAFDFTIGGQTETGGGGGQWVFDDYSGTGWENGANAITSNPDSLAWVVADGATLSPEVSKVVCYNTKEPHTTDNEAIFLVYLYPQTQLGQEDMAVILDLDGNATLIPDDLFTNNDQFFLTVRLADEQNSSVKLRYKKWKAAAPPNGWQSSTMTYNNQRIRMRWDRVEGSDPNAPIGSTPYSFFNFWLIPSEGYTVSRHNFAPSVTTAAGSGAVVAGDTYSTVDNGIKYNAVYLKDQNGGASPFTENWCPVTDYQTSDSIGYPKMEDGVYAATFYSAPKVNTYPNYTTWGGDFPSYLTDDVNYWSDQDGDGLVDDVYEVQFSEQSSNATFDALNYTNDTCWLNTLDDDLSGWESSNQDILKDTWNNERQTGIIFIDTASGPQSTNVEDVYDFPDNPVWGNGVPWIGPCQSCGETLDTHPLFPSQTETSYIPDFACGSDYNCNGVLMGIVGWSQYIPGPNPRDIVLTIHGHAMPEGDESCEDFDVSIEIQ